MLLHFIWLHYYIFLIYSVVQACIVCGTHAMRTSGGEEGSKQIYRKWYRVILQEHCLPMKINKWNLSSIVFPFIILATYFLEHY